MHLRILIASSIAVLLIFVSFSSSHPFEKPRVQAVTLPTSITISICGDSIVNAGEVCDDGFANNTGGYGSSTAERKCNVDCLSFGPYCGDGVLQARFTEECDDGNNTSGDLCSAACIAEVPAAPPPTPTVGSVPSAGAPIGSILSELETKVVLRGKAFPSADINILLDGEVLGTVKADVNADFLYTTNQVTPGTATFGFWAEDTSGAKSITTTVIFEVVQSAVTTVANILVPPTISLSGDQIVPGEPLTISGESVPNASVVSEISGGALTVFSSEVEESGAWSLQIDTNSLNEGFHSIKSLFEIDEDTKSGYGRALSFYIGTEPLSEVVSPDVNDDGKINLVDFSIFLLSWGGEDIRHDFNQDGTVSLADFSILLFNWTG